MQEVEWRSYINSALSTQDQTKIILHYDGKDPIPVSACTMVNKTLVDDLFERGARAIAIGVCDYSAEAIAFALGLSIRNVLLGENQVEYSTSNWKEGDLVGLCGTNFTFKGFSEDESFGRMLSYTCQQRKNSSQIAFTQSLSHISGRIQPCSPKAKPTKNTVKKSALSCAQQAYNDLSPEAKLFHDRMSLCNRAVIFATSQSPFSNIPPSRFHKGHVTVGDSNIPIDQCIKTAFINQKGEMAEYCSYGFAGTPAFISICRDDMGLGDLYCAQELIDDAIESGNTLPPWAIVIEAPEPEAIDESFAYIDELLDTDCDAPIVVFCDERTLRESQALDQLGFAKFLWTDKALTELDEAAASTAWQLSLREDRYANRLIRYEPTKDSGILSYTANAIYEVNSKRSAMSEEGQKAVATLSRLLSCALKQTEIASEETEREYARRIDSSMKMLCDTAYGANLSKEEINAISNASTLLKKAFTPDYLSKEEVAYERFKAALSRGKRICLIASDPISARESRKYWQDVFGVEEPGERRIRVVTLREFMRSASTSNDEEVFISGWFNRELMEKVLHSGLSEIFTIFLYRGSEGTELETDWYLDADSFWKRHHNPLLADTRKTLSMLGIIPDDALEDLSVQTKRRRETDASITQVIATIENERASFEAAAQGEESRLARPVYFSNGSHKWLGISTSNDPLEGDALIIIDKESDEAVNCARKTAAMLHPGDIVLRMEANGSALDSLCKDNFDSYEEVLENARSWREPIERAKASMTPNEIRRRLIDAGISKHENTINSWIRGSIRIAPNGENGRKDIMAIGEALGHPFSDEEIKRILIAGRIARGKRIEAGRNISKKIAQSFVDDVLKYGFQDAIDGFGLRHKSGKIDLLCVDHVGSPQRVSVNKLGYYFE